MTEAMKEIPEYLLERSRRHREKLEGRSPEMPSLGQRLATEFSLESGTQECSIAASDAWVVANKLYDSHLNPEHPETTPRLTSLFMTHEERDVAVNVCWLGDEAGSDASFRTRIGLGRMPSTDLGEGTLTLFGVVRGGVAFPLVSFSRSGQAYCDYLQFFGENTLDELESTNMYGWGQDDNGSRFDAVQAVGQLVKYKRNNQELLEVLKLNGRLLSYFGETTPECERLIHEVMETSVGVRYKKDYLSVRIGRNLTNYTTEVQVIAAEGHQRSLCFSKYITSQSDKRAVETIVVDRLNGIHKVDEQGELEVLSADEIEGILDAFHNGEYTVSTGQLALQATGVEVAKNTGVQYKDIPRNAALTGGVVNLAIGLAAANPVVEVLPRSAYAAGAAYVVGLALYKVQKLAEGRKN